MGRKRINMYAKIKLEEKMENYCYMCQKDYIQTSGTENFKICKECFLELYNDGSID